VVWPWEEQRAADQWAAHFEKELEAHWTAQAKQRKPVLVENGQRVWASAWTNLADVAYNVVYFQAVASGFTRNEVIAAAEEARDQARKLKWAANEYLVVGADRRGLITSRNIVINWQKAPAMIGQMMIKDKEGLLATIRDVYRQANGQRPQIAQVGQLVKAMQEGS
jgi:hypothetical protein